MKILSRLLLLVATASLMCGGVLSSVSAQQRPNIVLIYADDVGYGDFSSYGATSVRTPNVDRLAKQGLLFTSGYASSGSCTPSRYSMLTGEYAFRKQGTGVLPGDAALTVASHINVHFWLTEDGAAFEFAVFRSLAAAFIERLAEASEEFGFVFE